MGPEERHPLDGTAAGWLGPFTSFSSGSCENHPNGRALLAITAAGSASVHFDANQKDRDGTGIEGGSLGSLGWTARACAQQPRPRPPADQDSREHAEPGEM